MNITREIVKDLLPLYVAGEASADSRAAVEAALRDDPELSRVADALRDGSAALPAMAAAPSRDRAALDRAKGLIRLRMWLLAAALFLTGLPLSFTFDRGGFQFLLIRDAPVAAVSSLTAAAVLWIAFAIVARRVRVVGL